MKFKVSPSKLYAIFQREGILIKKAAEVGVYSFETSLLRPLIFAGIQCDLYEPVPEFCSSIKKDISNFSNVRLFEFAISNFDGEIELCLAGASTFNSLSKESPAINHDGFNKELARKIVVPCRDFYKQDDGDYDFISIDVEGFEYSVLKRMRSRPVLINIETQSRDYINPRLGSITDWMKENGYRVWFKHNTDTMFIRGNKPKSNFILGINGWLQNKIYFAGRL